MSLQIHAAENVRTTVQSTSASSKQENKAATAFRTISEVATSLDVPQHVLRFWETKFHQIRPLKRGGGRRYYRPEDIALLTDIKELLYGKGLTIRGVQKLLSENARPQVAKIAATPSMPIIEPKPDEQAATGLFSAPKAKETIPANIRREVEGVLTELKAMRDVLRQAGV